MKRLLLLAALLSACSPAPLPRPAIADVTAAPTQPPADMPAFEDTAEEIPAAIGGSATWYCGNGSACTRGYGPSDMVAAIDPTLGIARGTRLRVDYAGRSVTVRVVDVCQCKGSRIIDLTSGAFGRLAPLSAGVIPVAIEVTGAEMTLPPTDGETP